MREVQALRVALETISTSTMALNRLSQRIKIRHPSLMTARITMKGRTILKAFATWRLKKASSIGIQLMHLRSHFRKSVSHRWLITKKRQSIKRLISMKCLLPG